MCSSLLFVLGNFLRDDDVWKQKKPTSVTGETDAQHDEKGQGYALTKVDNCLQFFLAMSQIIISHL